MSYLNTCDRTGAAAESASLTAYAQAITVDPTYRKFISPAALESLLHEARERGLRAQSMYEAVVNED